SDMNIKGPIILLDDDEDDHDIIQAICENLGVYHYLRHFTDGFELLEFLKTTNESPFVILSDINMPHVGGMEVRQIINEDTYLRSKSIPFIFFSTAASFNQVRKA